MVVLPVEEERNDDDDGMPINIRTLNGIDLSSLKYQQYNGKAAGQPYQV